jgi:hypothetical protein
MDINKLINRINTKLENKIFINQCVKYSLSDSLGVSIVTDKDGIILSLCFSYDNNYKVTSNFEYLNGNLNTDEEIDFFKLKLLYIYSLIKEIVNRLMKKYVIEYYFNSYFRINNNITIFLNYDNDCNIKFIIYERNGPIRQYYSEQEIDNYMNSNLKKRIFPRLTNYYKF